MAVARKDARLNLRLSTASDELIRGAAESRGKSVSDYVTEAALDRARQDLADQKHFVLEEASWDAFVAALDRPARVNQRLVALFEAHPPIVD